MKSFKAVIAVSILALSATSALAQTYGSWGDQSSQGAGTGSQILNNQINLQNNWATLNASVDTVGGDVVAQGSAAGNMIDITTMNNTRVLKSRDKKVTIPTDQSVLYVTGTVVSSVEVGEPDHSDAKPATGACRALPGRGRGCKSL